MTTSISVTKARAGLSQLVGRAEDHHERIIITVHGKPAAALISAYELESMEETLDILSDPVAMRDLDQAQQDIDRGDVYPLV